ncbi:MAG: class I SAM-dependent methyltransferase [Dokdonella sp.]|uniref:class I SAM-dependent methyltransferase n=1 Tax=Dokdonella sp. TaxID=2291710 RepID=UPI00326502CE
MLKQAYVATVRACAIPLRAGGILDRWQRAPRESFRFWLGSQFAIYDAMQLMRIDVPWWSFPAIREVEHWLSARKDVRAFEYGSGASTVWLARRCSSVVSAEHDAPFLRAVESAIARDNVELRLAEPERSADPRVTSGRNGYAQYDFSSYVDTIGTDRYDLIIIDGRARVACLERALTQLADGGLIVFDNSERARYADAIAHVMLPLRRCRGWAPALPYRSETTLIGALPQESR